MRPARHSFAVNGHIHGLFDPVVIFESAALSRKGEAVREGCRARSLPLPLQRPCGRLITVVAQAI